MPRPTTKQELVDAATNGFGALQKVISTLPDAVRDGPFAFEDRDRCLRDVLVHLTVSVTIYKLNKRTSCGAC